MLNVLVFDEPTTLKLRMEGLLDDSTLPRFREAIFESVRFIGHRKLLIDAGDLEVDGERAKSILLSAIQQGVTVVAARGTVARLLEQQEVRTCKESCGLFRRISFFFWLQCRISDNPICMSFSRLFHQHA